MDLRFSAEDEAFRAEVRSFLEDALRSFEPGRRDALRDLVVNDRDPQLERATDLLKGVNLFSKRTSVPDAKPKSGKAPAPAPKPLN